LNNYFGIRKGQPLILAFNVAVLSIFSVVFMSRGNYEFLTYVGVTIFFMALIILTNRKVYYPNFMLWILSFWSLAHMCGGGILLDGRKLYEFILLDVVKEPYPIFRYDQFVHITGFAGATLAMYYLLKPHLKQDHPWIALSVVVVMAGLGVGALNEIVEFLVSLIIGDTGVGGYINTSLDLVSDLVGAIIAMTAVYVAES
jgi:uncharacterized membrane protein YwaF